MGNDCCGPGGGSTALSRDGSELTTPNELSQKPAEDTDSIVQTGATPALSTGGPGYQPQQKAKQELLRKPSLRTVPEMSALETSDSLSDAGRPKFNLGLMLDDDIDADSSVSATWIMDPSGSMMHQETGVRISPESGISTPDRAYTLSASEIELEDGATLGAGAGGQVRKGRIKKTGEVVAIKCMKVDDKAKKSMMLSEIKTLIECEKCDSLVNWYGGFVSKSGSIVHVVLEFMDLGSLRDLLNRLPASSDVRMPTRHLACTSLQVVSGLAFLHERHLLHRDIKPENILHSRAGVVKLTDFGISKSLGSETEAFATTFMGTTVYMSPERAEGTDYTLASDVWSCGLVVYELACGKFAFADALTFPALFAALVDDPEPRLDAAKFDVDLCDFVAKCLTRNAAARPSAQQLLQHRFASSDVAGSVEMLAQFLAGL